MLAIGILLDFVWFLHLSDFRGISRAKLRHFREERHLPEGAAWAQLSGPPAVDAGVVHVLQKQSR